MTLSEQTTKFFDDLRKLEWLNRRLWIYFAGWFGSFLVMYLPEISTTAGGFLGVVHVFFWFKLIEHLETHLTIPSEFLWTPLIGLTFWEYVLVQTIAPDAALGDIAVSTGLGLNLLQVSLLAAIELLFGLLVSINNQHKKGILVWLLILHFPLQSQVGSDGVVIRFLLMALLIGIFVRRTRWLERFTQQECWVYWIIFLAVLQILFWLNPVSGVPKNAFVEKQLFYQLPGMVYQLLVAYVIAVTIKIPAILIYNHASLARKLKIAGVFQSSIPQLIQLVSLLLIFYGSIVAWQSQIIRDHVREFWENAPNHEASEVLQHFALADSQQVLWEGYRPVSVRFLPKKGVLRMYPVQLEGHAASIDSAQADFFLFTKWESPDSVAYLTMRKIDQSFLTETIIDGQKFLGANRFLFYTVDEQDWIWRYHRTSFLWDDEDIQIYALGLIDYGKIEPRIELEEQAKQYGVINLFFGALNNLNFTFGRVLIPIWDDGSTNQFAVFDVVFRFLPTIGWNDLLTIFLAAFVIYSLLNYVIIRKMVGFGTQINKIIVDKFAQLRKGIQQIAAGNLDYRIRFEGNDEFVALAESFNSMGQRLKETIEERREKDRLQFELQAARNVQISLLPQVLPRVDGYELAAILHTATEVGGDFYDVFPLEKNKTGEVTKLLFTIGDVSGKGSSAALYMAQCMSLIRFSSQFTSDPHQICVQLNHYFATKIQDKQIFVTLLIGVLDVPSNTVQYVRAGHTEPIVIPADPEKPITLLHSKGMGLGLSAGEKLFSKTLERKTVSLQPGDTLLLYTDGVVEASRPDKQSGEPLQFDETKLLAAIDNQRGKSAGALQQALDQTLSDFYNGHPRVDDYTLLILQRKQYNA
jgi:serine phosphatase RsbU (regulator of sigma subunit)